MPVYRIEPQAIVVSVRLTPRAGHDAIDGIRYLCDDAPVVVARVRAVPEAGRANAALAALMAKSFGVTRSAVTIAAGAKSRLKSVRIAGDVSDLAKTVEALPTISKP